jgi:hypothetical protein
MISVDLGLLLRPSSPWLLGTLGSHSQLTNTLWDMRRNGPLGVAVRFLRGSRMKTTAQLYEEFAAALQFPYYFGHNGPAFDECLADLEWLEASAYILAILDAQDFLVQEQPKELDLFLDSFLRTCEVWSKPIAAGEPWDRPAKPFHVLFQFSAEVAEQLPPQVSGLPVLAENCLP